jgi:hypothetical protein
MATKTRRTASLLQKVKKSWKQTTLRERIIRNAVPDELDSDFCLTLRSQVVGFMDERQLQLTLCACIRALKAGAKSRVIAINWISAIVIFGFRPALRHLVELLNHEKKSVRVRAIRTLSNILPSEAAGWLSRSKQTSALAGNRFVDTNDALQFVLKLYSCGATAVTIGDYETFTDRFGIVTYETAYADSLIVELPECRFFRKQLFQIINAERLREGWDKAADKGAQKVWFWWD